LNKWVKILIHLKKYINLIRGSFSYSTWVEKIKFILKSIADSNANFNLEISEINRILDNHAIPLIPDDLILLKVFREILISCINKVKYQSKSRVNKILVSDIENSRHIPHKVIFLIDMNSVNYPKLPKSENINLLNNKYHLGDPSVFEREKYAFLELLIACRDKFIDLIKKSSKPIFYTGGGVINSGPQASEYLRELVSLTGFPITSTLQGLGAYPGDDNQFLGMLGMHGTYEANNAMHDCDLLINIGARFDDRITGKIDEFSPKSKKVHIDIDPSSINKIIKVDLALVGDVKEVLKGITKTLKKKNLDLKKSNKQQIAKWWEQIQKWRTKNSLHFKNSDETIKPQHAVQRLYELTKNQDTFITTEVGQHQMWAAQHYKFNKPNRWMTSGGLGTMGYGLPAAIGVQIANPGKLVVDIAGEASVLMTMQEMSTAVQYNLPIKIFILNNQYMGMVRQWQELLHEKNYSESYSEALPDFIKMAEAYGCKGIKADNPADLDDKIQEMIDYDGPVIFDCHVDPNENCFPMIPSGKPHNQMILGPNDQEENKIKGKGKALV